MKHRTPKLSVIVLNYNMNREIRRTLYSLMPPYQTGVNSAYRVCVVDNGSTDPEGTRDICASYGAIFYQAPDATKSPVKALNWAVEQEDADIVCAWIDGARMSSPRLVASALAILSSHSDAIVGSHSFHIGPRAQNMSVREGYDRNIEDMLLSSVPWETDGYALFDISSFDPSSRFGVLALPAETNSLFMSRDRWTEIGGYDERFRSAGGGLANLEIWERSALHAPDKLFMLLGEGTFHQFHGGVTTNSVTDSWPEMHREYFEIFGRRYIRPAVRPILRGTFHSRLEGFVCRGYESVLLPTIYSE